ncbi:hypothetical protein JCM33374_g5730 [Metschnikowia sp. JCM 33374]|nr:hypothetical protein JCM33374_g5730 [Metschnikowia sp. JCM 33374]
MTTNHRPTLESKRGRDIAIKDTIQHARSTKGQTSLKLRSDIAGTQIDHTRARKALDELESESKRHKKAEDCIILHTDSENDKQILTSKEIEKNLSPVAVSEDAPNPQEDKTSVGVSSVSNTRTGEISEEIDPR